MKKKKKINKKSKEKAVELVISCQGVKNLNTERIGGDMLFGAQDYELTIQAEAIKILFR